MPDAGWKPAVQQNFFERDACGLRITNMKVAGDLQGFGGLLEQVLTEGADTYG